MTNGYIYDLDALKKGLVSVEANIEALKEGLENELEKQREYKKHIEGAELILKLHKQGMIKDGSKD